MTKFKINLIKLFALIFAVAVSFLLVTMPKSAFAEEQDAEFKVGTFVSTTVNRQGFGFTIQVNDAWFDENEANEYEYGVLVYPAGNVVDTSKTPDENVDDVNVDALKLFTPNNGKVTLTQSVSVGGYDLTYMRKYLERKGLEATEENAQIMLKSLLAKPFSAIGYIKVDNTYVYSEPMSAKSLLKVSVDNNESYFVGEINKVNGYVNSEDKVVFNAEQDLSNVIILATDNGAISKEDYEIIDGDIVFSEDYVNQRRNLSQTTYVLTENSVLAINLEYRITSTTGVDFTIVNNEYAEVISGYTGTANVYIAPIYNGYPVKSIGDMAFYDCTSLESIEIPNSVESIGNFAFEDCTSLENIELSNSVESIGYGAFEGCTSLKTVKFEEGSVLESIGECAFYDCTSIESIVIPNSVTSIGGRAFAGCSSLESIVIPNSVTSIGGRAFAFCSSLESIEIPSSVTSIGEYAFEYCTSLERIEIPNSVTSIGSQAFYYCSSLKTVTFEEGSVLESIGNYAFYNCTSIESIVIPNSVESIGYDAFRDCSSLKTVTFEEGSVLESIGNYAFEYCTSLESIEIPNSVESIGAYTFTGCDLLKTVTFEEGSVLESIGNYAFYNCTSIESIEIPNSVTSIGDGAFAGCTSLKSIEIPNSVTSIGDYAFAGCSSLESIVIPNSVESIGSQAFASCSSLTIYCEATEKPSGWDSDWNYTNCPVEWGYNG